MEAINTEATEAKTEAATLVQPEDRITITYEGAERTLFMSFLRQNSLLRFINAPTDVIYLPSNPDLCEVVLKIMLADKGGAGKMLEMELDEEAMTSDDYERVISWVQDHMTYFFMKRFREMALRAQVLEPMAQALQSQAGGSVSSTSETAVAGPSA